MILIFGGVYQGKLDFAIDKYNLTLNDCHNCSSDINYSYKILNNFDRYILHLIKNNINPTEYIKNNMNQLNDKIIIVNDISSGIVPIDPLMRQWREEVGRCTLILAKNAKNTYRLFCGIPSELLQ